MKKLSIILILFIFLVHNSSQAKENCISIDTLEWDEETSTYYSENDKPFSGCMEYFIQDGELIQGTIENGKLKKDTIYVANGTLEGEKYYSDNGSHIYYKIFYPDGTLKLEGNAENGHTEGIEKGYFENGELKWEVNYKNGELEGNYKKYYEDFDGEKVYSLGNHKNGQIEGEVTIHSMDGKIKRTVTYRNGKKVYPTKNIKIDNKFQEAIVADSVPDEYRYLDQEYPNYTLILQYGFTTKEVNVDIYEIETEDKQKKKIYFDISSFYPSFDELLDQ